MLENKVYSYRILVYSSKVKVTIGLTYIYTVLLAGTSVINSKQFCHLDSFVVDCNLPSMFVVFLECCQR